VHLLAQQICYNNVLYNRNLQRLFNCSKGKVVGAMVYVKESPIGVLFPVVIAMLAPLRFYLEKSGVIKKEYMDVLDEE
jgi:hypothetical protein